jgi:DNA-binding response OmpR family regulator
MQLVTSRRERPILVVDDDAKIVRLVRTYLERDGYTVTEASDGTSALAAIALHDPQLVVLDLMLPQVDGLAVLRAVRRTSDTPVIVLSARGTTSDRITGLIEGADDYVPKPFSPAELALRVRRVLARATSPEPASMPPTLHGDLVLDPARHSVTVAGEPVRLTAVEFRLLAALLDAAGRILTRDQLLDAVYGHDQDSVLDRTIDVHVGRLRDKLHDSAERPRYVETVRGLGYRATEPHEAAATRRDPRKR